MASNYEIGASISLDGEQTFRQSVTSCNNALKEITSESKLVSAQFDGQKNSMAALEAQHDVLAKAVEAHKAKEEALSNALNHAVQNQNQIGESLEKLKSARDTEQAKLEELKKTYGDASDEVKAQEEKLQSLNDQIEKGEKNYETAGNRVQKWQTQLNNAQAETIKANNALEENEKYLDEASKSADGCADSIDEFGKKVKASTAEVEDSSDGFSSWSDKFQNAFANQALSVAKEVLGKIKDAAIEAAQYIVEVGSSFEAAMSEVAAISGASGDELDALTEKAKELGSSTKFSATEAAEAFKYMSLAGWSNAEMLSAVDGVMSLAAASGMELADASDMVTDYLSAFNMEASQAAYMSDMLAYAQANSNTTAEQLGEAYGNCAANLNAAGQDIETVTALLEGMANQGMKGSEAGTALGSVMSQITQKMEDGAIQIGETTVSVADAQGNFRDLTDIITDISGALDGMGTQERSSALAATFNKTALSGLNLILNEGIYNISDYEDSLRECDGAAEDMADTMQDNLQGAITQMESAEEGLGVALYEKVSGPLTSAVKVATGLINGITGALTSEKSELENFIDDIKTSNDEVDSLISNSKEAMSGSETDIAQLEQYRQTLLELNSETEKTEYDKYRIKTIVSELADSIPELSDAYDEETGSINLTDEAINRLMNTQEAYLLQQAATEAKADAMQALFEAEMNVAKAESAVTQSSKDLTNAQEANEKSADFLAGGAGDLCAEVADLTQQNKEANEEWDKAKDLQAEAEEQYKLTSDAVDSASDKIAELTGETGDATESTEEMAGALENVTDAENETSDALEDLKESISDSITSSVDMLNEFDGGMEVTAEDIKKNLQSQIDGMSEWSDNMQTLAGAAGQGMSQELYDALVEMGPSSANLVNTLVETLTSDMENGTSEFSEICGEWSEAMALSDDSEILASYSSVGDGINSAVQTSIDTVKETVSTGTEGIAEEASQIDEEIAKGVEANKAEVATATETVIAESTATIAKKYTDYRSQTQTAAKGIADGILATKANAMQAAVEVAKSALTSANGQTSQFTEVGKNMMAGVAAGLNQNSQLVYNAVTTILNKAKTEANKATDSHSPSRVWRNQVGAYMSQGLALGITDGTKDVIQAAVDLAKAAEDATTGELQIQSPSKVFKSFGAYISEGLKIGIVSKKGTAVKASASMAKEVYEKASSWLTSYKKTHSVGIEDEKKFWKQIATVVKSDGASYKKALKNAAVNDSFVSEVQKKLKSAFDVSWLTTKSGQTVKKEAATYYKELTKAATTYIENKTATDNLTLQQEKYFWQQVQKYVDKGTQTYADAAKKIKKLNTEIKKEQTSSKKSDSSTIQYGVSGDGLEAYKSLYNVSAYAELQYWQQVRKSKNLTAAQKLAIDEKIVEAETNYYDELKELEDDYYDKCSEVNEKLQEEVESLTETYTSALSERKSAIKDSFGMFDEFTSESETADVLLANMQSQVAGYELWMSQLEELRSRGIVSDEWMEELQELGPDNAATIVALNQASDEQLQAMQEAYDAKNLLAQKEAEKELASLKTETDEKIEALKKAAQSELDAYKAEYEASVAEVSEAISEPLKKLATQATTLGETATAKYILGLKNEAESKETKQTLKGINKVVVDSVGDISTSMSATGKGAVDTLVNRMEKRAKAESTAETLSSTKETIASGLKGLTTKGKTIGTNMLDGLLTNLNDEEKIKKSAATFVDTLEAAIKKEAGIASPSKRFRDVIGKQIPAGIAVGIETGTEEAADAGEEMVKSILDATAEQIQSQQATVASTLDGIDSSGISLVNSIAAQPLTSLNSVTVNNSGAAEMMAGMITELRNVKDEISRMKVVMDTGALVGEIAEPVGDALTAQVMRGW